MGRGSTEYCIVLGVRRKTGDSDQDSREDTNEEWDEQDRGCRDKDTETHREKGRQRQRG